MPHNVTMYLLQHHVDGIGGGLLVVVVVVFEKFYWPMIRLEVLPVIDHLKSKALIM